MTHVQFPTNAASEGTKRYAEKLTDQSPDVLRDIARYADKLAEHREREAQLAEQDEQDEEVEAEADDHPLRNSYRPPTGCGGHNHHVVQWFLTVME